MEPPTLSHGLGLVVPYSGKLSKEKTFANFAVLWLYAKVFFVKFGAWRPLAWQKRAIRKSFVRENRLFTNSRKFSPSKVYRYTVYHLCAQCTKAFTITYPSLHSQSALHITMSLFLCEFIHCPLSRREMTHSQTPTMHNRNTTALIKSPNVTWKYACHIA